jgi:hypothetical protein
MLYSCLIEEDEPLRPFVQMYWAYADELGEALESMVAAAALNGLGRPRCKRADPSDPAHLKRDLVRSADGHTLWSPTRYFFPPTVGFTPPYGVIASNVDGPFDLDDIGVGYSRSESDGLICIETNTLENDLLDDYVSIVRALEPLRAFWVKLHDHWPPQLAEQILVNEHIVTANRIGEFLNDWSGSVLRNGFVSITGYLEEGATNVSITDHKKIVALTYSSAVADQIVGLLPQMGYGEIDPFFTIDCEMHHWHYRDPNGSDYARLVDELMAAGFTPWTPSGE